MDRPKTESRGTERGPQAGDAQAVKKPWLASRNIPVPKGLPKGSRASLEVAGRCLIAACLAPKFVWQEELWFGLEGTLKRP